MALRAMTLGDQVRARYPRLIRAMVRGSNLTAREAVEALVEYQVFGMTDEPSTEPVARAGGQLTAIRRGIRHRHESESTDGRPARCESAPSVDRGPSLDTFA